MSLRFRRSLRLAPGVRVNLGLRGPSLSVGPRGIGVTLGPAGVTTHAGLPGTGLSYRGNHSIRERGLDASLLPADSTRVGIDTYSVSVGMDLAEDGQLQIHSADGSQLDPRLERRIRTEHREQLEAWLEKRCAEIDGEIEGLEQVHLGTPGPDVDHRLAPEPFDAAPSAPPEEQPGFWERFFPRLRRARERRHEGRLALYRSELDKWSGKKAEHEADWERRRVRTEVERTSSVDVMHELLEEALGAVSWPRETLVTFEVVPPGQRLGIDVDLPEIEDMPTRQATVAQRGLKLNIRALSEAQVRRMYFAHIHGVLFRTVGVAFATLPSVQTVTCSGFSQRVDPATGKIRNEFLLSVRVGREAWRAVDFANLGRVDPVLALERFDLRVKSTAAGRLTAIEPFEH